MFRVPKKYLTSSTGLDISGVNLICKWDTFWDTLFTSLERRIDDYAKDGGPGEISVLCSFYHGTLRTSIKTNANKFAISSHTALKLSKQALESYLKIKC